jgi:exoribonuclease R
MDDILDSHDVIAYLMVMMNYLSAQDLKKHKTGIFRTIKLKTEYDIPEQTPKKIKRFIKGWNSTGGKYLKFEHYGSHQLLNLDAYVHITSPIRRLIDIFNI